MQYAWRTRSSYRTISILLSIEGTVVMRFYSRGDPTNLRNCEVWPSEKQGMNVYIVTETVLQTWKKDQLV